MFNALDREDIPVPTVTPEVPAVRRWLTSTEHFKEHCAHLRAQSYIIKQVLHNIEWSGPFNMTIVTEPRSAE